MMNVVWGCLIIFLLIIIIGGLSCIFDILKQIRDKRNVQD